MVRRQPCRLLHRSARTGRNKGNASFFPRGIRCRRSKAASVGADLAMSPVGRYCCKSRKSKGSENLAKLECWRSQPLQGSAELIRASAVAFSLIDVVPHIAARETHGRS